jgi:hypothetical protein
VSIQAKPGPRKSESLARLAQATAIDKVVAQISKSAVSQVSNLRGASKFRPPADLEIGDTAGLEACATFR